MTNHILTTWLTQADAARRLGVSREAIRQAIASRRIEWNGKSGRDCRVRGDLLPARTLPPLTRAPKGSANKKSSPAPAATVPAIAPKGTIAPKNTITPKGSRPPKTPANPPLPISSSTPASGN